MNSFLFLFCFFCSVHSTETNFLIFRKLSPLRSLAMNQTSSDGHSNYSREKTKSRIIVDLKLIFIIIDDSWAFHQLRALIFIRAFAALVIRSIYVFETILWRSRTAREINFRHVSPYLMSQAETEILMIHDDGFSRALLIAER